MTYISLKAVSYTHLRAHETVLDLVCRLLLEKKMLPCAAYLKGEYCIKDIYAGVPIIVGKNGVEKIEEINLDEKEKSEFLHSVEAVKKLWEAASKIDPDLAK